MSANEQNQKPEGWTDDMRPMADPMNRPPVLEVDDSSGTPEVEQSKPVDEGAEYWRQKFEEAQAENEANAPYKAIMERLKTDGDLVDVLHQHINGEFVEARKQQEESIFDVEEEDEYGNPVPKNDSSSETRSGEPTEEQLAQARELGRQNAKAEMELKQFLDNLMTTGVPEHVAHKFVETINNPTGFNIADLYAAYMNKETREKEAREGEAPRQEAPEGTPMGTPVASAGGSTDKPTGDKFRETPDSDGHKFVSNPNAL